MTQTEHLVAFIAMAVAIVAILVVGTLAAADILRLGPRRDRGGKRPATRPIDRVVADLAPLGASLMPARLGEAVDVAHRPASPDETTSTNPVGIAPTGERRRTP